MAIIELPACHLSYEIKENISQLVQFFPTTSEFSFCEDELARRKWSFCAIDDANLEDGEVDKLISLTPAMTHFYCLPLDFLKQRRNLYHSDTYFYFENTFSDWENILSVQNEFTLWESLIFNPSENGLFIIKPWSVGYNLLIAGSPPLVQSFSRHTNWRLNQKFPTCPL